MDKFIILCNGKVREMYDFQNSPGLNFFWEQDFEVVNFYIKHYKSKCDIVVLYGFADSNEMISQMIYGILKTEYINFMKKNGVNIKDIFYITVNEDEAKNQTKKTWYYGDIFLIDRLERFYWLEPCKWNNEEVITLEDIDNAISNFENEEIEHYGDLIQHVCSKENKSKQWHIGRILYFINHPEEIRYIEVEDAVSEKYDFPVPTIIDGNHRFMAAIWLKSKGKMKNVHCLHRGNKTMVEYLSGKSVVY